MEYIECTHCGKRYAVNDKIRASEGEFVRCKNCLEKFEVVVLSVKTKDDRAEDMDATQGWDPVSTNSPEENQSEVVEADDVAVNEEPELRVAEDIKEESQEIVWDPTQTMPDMESDAESADEPLSDEQVQAQAEATLAAIQEAKKKKVVTYAIFGAVVILLGLTLYMALVEHEPEQMTAQHVAPVKRLSIEDIDKNSPECRTAAARQWILDYKVMHTNYNAKSFMMMLKQSENRASDVNEVCKNKRLLNLIIDAATTGERPEWFAAEIQAISRK